MSRLHEITGPLEYSIALLEAIELCLESIVDRETGHFSRVEAALLAEWRTSMSLINLTRDQVRTAFDAAEKREGLLS